MQRIEYKDSNAETPLNTYLSSQIDVINLKKLGYGEFYGIYTYGNNSVHVQILDATVEQMKTFGMDIRVQDLAIEKLNSNKLILRSDYAHLELGKH